MSDARRGYGGMGVGGFATANPDEEEGEDGGEEAVDDEYYSAAGLAYEDDRGHVGQCSRSPSLSVQEPATPGQHTGQLHLQPRAAADIASSRGGSKETHALSGQWPPISAVGVRIRRPPTSHDQTVSPAPETLDMHNLSIRKDVPGGTQLSPDEVEEQPVNRSYLVRLEQYRRGYCPFCGKFFGNPLPVVCPYPDCKRNLSMCLEYCGPRQQQQSQQSQRPQEREQPHAPPPLAERAFLDARPQRVLYAGGQGVQPNPAPIKTSRSQAVPYMQAPPRRDAIPNRSISRRQAVDNLRAQISPRRSTPRPPPLPHHRSPKPSSPSNTIRTIWPAPSAIREAATHEFAPDRASEQVRKEREERDRKHRALPLPPRPSREGGSNGQQRPQPHLARSASAPLRGQQHNNNASSSSSPLLSSSPSLKYSTTTPLAATPSLGRSGSSSGTATQRTPEAQVHTKTRARAQAPANNGTGGRRAQRPAPVDSRFREAGSGAANTTSSGRTRSRPVTPLSGDDIDFLAWKRPEELAEFAKDMERGNDADLFLGDNEERGLVDEKEGSSVEEDIDERGDNADVLLDIISSYADEPQLDAGKHNTQMGGYI
ncbi:hypothetical protein MFIFM68171_05162 [Madurella fahalii]|uniref:Uncharacterized protein n=1 Tax=Madurella fahalii TaxID=1157608 RepID=A0ABQ0GB30_9PEZI